MALSYYHCLLFAESIGGLPKTYFSAVCWLFGRYLHDNLGIPIGLVSSTWGGTPVEAWSSEKALANCGLNSEYYYLLYYELGGCGSSLLV